MTKKATEHNKTGKIAKVAKDFCVTLDALGSKIMAVQVCKDFCWFMTPTISIELEELEKEYHNNGERSVSSVDNMV